MKTLLALILAATAVTAHATDIFYSGNENGGVIMMTDRQANCPLGSHVIYTTLAAGELSDTGCWRYAEPFVHVVWDDGTVRDYNSQNFTETTEGKEKYPTAGSM
jgi:hypothetical protein